MTENNEMVLAETVVEETETHIVKKLKDGTFAKQMKYDTIFSRVPETEEEQIELYNVFNNANEDNENIVGMSKMIGETFGIDEYYTNPYNSFDEKTGLTNTAVNTTIKDGETYYVTSSKSVYHSLNKLIKAFPNKKIFVKVTGTKRTNGVQIDIALSHLADK